MQRIRFVIVSESRSDVLNWRRFVSGVLFALTAIILSITCFQIVQHQFSSHSSAQGSYRTFTTETGGIGETVVIVRSAISEAKLPIPITSPSADLATNYPMPNIANIPATEPTNTPLIATNTPLIATNTPLIATNTPLIATNTPLIATHTPLIATHTPLIATDTPLIATHTPTLLATDSTVNATMTGKPTQTPQPTRTPTRTPTPTYTSQAVSNSSGGSVSTNTPQPTHTATGATPTSTNTPRPTTKPSSIDITPFGIEINKGYVVPIIAQAKEIGVSWVRYNGIHWDEVESVEGNPVWSTLSPVESDIRALSEADLQPMVIIRGTPVWAQKANSLCGPIKEEKLDAFAAFVRQVVQRYSVAPYNVKYWEIGNEPDVDPSLIGGTMPFGCWGDNNDPYYGGEYFAKMLKKVSEQVSDINPRPIIVLGGLLLDCDPSYPPEGKRSDDCKPAKFLEGILKNGGGGAFDIVAFHAYTAWNGKKEDWDLTQTSWKHRGGAIVGKFDFVKQILQQHGVSKPVITNEIALLCWNDDPTCYQGSFLADQQNYLIRGYIRAWASGLRGASWYTLNYAGWHGTGLLNSDGSVRPAYGTFKFLANKLKDAQFERKETLSNRNHEGFIFRRGSQEYRVYWSNDTTTFDVPRPSTPFTVYNLHGQTVQVPNSSPIPVGFDPVVIEIG